MASMRVGITFLIFIALMSGAFALTLNITELRSEAPVVTNSSLKALACSDGNVFLTFEGTPYIYVRGKRNFEITATNVNVTSLLIFNNSEGQEELFYTTPFQIVDGYHSSKKYDFYNTVKLVYYGGSIIAVTPYKTLRSFNLDLESTALHGNANTYARFIDAVADSNYIYLLGEKANQTYLQVMNASFQIVNECPINATKLALYGGEVIAVSPEGVIYYFQNVASNCSYTKGNINLSIAAVCSKDDTLIVSDERGVLHYYTLQLVEESKTSQPTTNESAQTAEENNSVQDNMTVNQTSDGESQPSNASQTNTSNVSEGSSSESNSTASTEPSQKERNNMRTIFTVVFVIGVVLVVVLIILAGVAYWLHGREPKKKVPARRYRRKR